MAFTRGKSKTESGLLQEANSLPLLSSERERSLARLWIEREDEEALGELVASHIRLVVSIAKGYRGYNMSLEDLEGAGSIGLMEAARRFDPDRGNRLSTYAILWIKAAIRHHISAEWSLVKTGTTAPQKRLFFNLRKMKAQMGVVGDGDMLPEHVAKIAKDLDVPEQDVINMNRRLEGSDHSLNMPVRMDSEGELQDWLVDESESQEDSLAEREELSGRQALLANALKTLNDRERHILIERRLKENPVTLEELSQLYDISRERVRQIEVRAFEKLQKAMRTAVAEQQAEAALRHRVEERVKEKEYA